MRRLTAARFDSCPCCGKLEFEVAWLNSRASPIETSDDFFYGGKRFIHEIDRCLGCGFAFIADPETGRSEAFYTEADPGLYLRQSRLRRDYFTRLKAKLIRRGLIENEIRSVIDLGAGDEAWLGLWPAAKHSATETNPVLRQRLNACGVHLIADLPNDLAAADLVSAFDFLEHLENPVELVRQIRCAANDHARLVVSVPDIGTWAARLAGWRYYLVTPMHFSYFTEAALSHLLKSQFPDRDVEIFPSPRMQLSFDGLSRWLAPGTPRKRWHSLVIPLYYRASLIGLVSPRSDRAG